MTTFTTRTDAIADIVTAIEATGEVADARAQYDVDAIADAVLTPGEDGYQQTADEGEFWAAVERHAR